MVSWKTRSRRLLEDAVPVEGLAVAGGEVGEVRRRVGDEEDRLGHAQVRKKICHIFSLCNALDQSKPPFSSRGGKMDRDCCREDSSEDSGCELCDEMTVIPGINSNSGRNAAKVEVGSWDSSVFEFEQDQADQVFATRYCLIIQILHLDEIMCQSDQYINHPLV